MGRDQDNVAKIECLAGIEQSEAAVAVLRLEMLKWDHRPAARCRSSMLSIIFGGSRSKNFSRPIGMRGRAFPRRQGYSSQSKLPKVSFWNLRRIDPADRAWGARMVRGAKPRQSQPTAQENPRTAIASKGPFSDRISLTRGPLGIVLAVLFLVETVMCLVVVSQVSRLPR
jgi:hypothetical protein